jgi:crotonobetainyl-CoA:carnitine CoA-transferase CaiB-like acyl-CoA transferase
LALRGREGGQNFNPSFAKAARVAIVEVDEIVEPDVIPPELIDLSGDSWHFGRTPAVVGSTPEVGEHNEEALGLLGDSEAEIAKLYASGA